MDYSEAVDELFSRKSNRKEPAIRPVKKALDSLGRPDREYRVILVGGTNGKGSTTDMISELLQSQGFKVGKFKSPHLVSVRERIQIDGEKIPREDLLQLYRELKEMELSFFEFMTVAAYRYFSNREVDYAVMEVGMGGRLDATNVAEPFVSVITNIQEDHIEYLGETREEIAEEKSGIIPQDGALITPEDLKPVIEKAEERNSEVLRPLKLHEKDGKLETDNQRFNIPVEGSYQKQNLETALKTVETIEKLPEDLQKALEDLECPGRMEKISNKPFILLDGAHNPAAVEEIKEDLPENFICVFNALRSKNYQEMISKLEEKASEFLFTETDFRASEKAFELDKTTDKKSKTFETPEKAMKTAVESGDPIVVTGSLYLVGAVKQLLDQQSLNTVKPKI